MTHGKHGRHVTLLCQ